MNRSLLCAGAEEEQRTTFEKAMTTQMKDTVLFSAEAFDLAEEKGKGLFEPHKHGLSPVLMSTACRRGYLCTYDVVENSLRLHRLLIKLYSSRCST